MDMDRRKTTRRRNGAFWLLLLAFVSVLAPVFANSYVCPMAKAAREHIKPCCEKTASLQGTATPGHPQVEPPCDCPKLSWSADVNDQVRELRTGSENIVGLLEFPALVLTNFIEAQTPVRRFDHLVNRVSPPLWLWNQSILC